MNLLELRTEIRRRLREETAAKSNFTDAALTKFVNEAIKDICIKGKVFQKTRTFTVSSTVASYPMPWDYLSPITLNNPSGVALDPIQARNKGNVYIITGKSLYYYESQTAATLNTRQNITTYAAQTILVPAAVNGFMYEVTIAGETGVAPPVFSTSSGSTTADGAATLTCRELNLYLPALTLVDTPTTAGGGTGTYTLIHQAMDEGLYVDTDAPNFSWIHHLLLVDYSCWVALMSERQVKDAIPFITNYAKGLGLKVEDYMGVVQK